MSVEKVNFNILKQENKSFTTFYNQVIQNINDSFMLGVYCYLSSLPHDWNVNRKHLMNHFDVGKDKIANTLSWLNRNHLIEYMQERNSDNTFGKTSIVIKDGRDFIEKVVINRTETSVDRAVRSPEIPLTGRTAPTYINIKDTNKIENTYTNKKQEAHREKRDVAAEQQLVLPDWLNKELWEEFIQHRKSIKSPISLIAQKKTITKLDKLRSAGQNIEEVINEAIINGWKGVFPIKQQKEFNHGKEKRNGNTDRNIGESRNLQQEQTEHVKKRWTTEQREILERGAGVRWDESTARYERIVPKQAERDVSHSSRHEDELRYLDSTITPFLGLFGD